MKRRRFIQLSTYTAVVLGLPVLDACKSKPVNKAIAEPPFLEQFLNAKEIQQTGNAYLKKFSAENSRDKLEQLLLENSTLTKDTDAVTVHSFFNKKIRDDYAAHRTVIPNGWILSLTEARQCALFSLITKQ